VFVDEMGTNISLDLLYAWSPRGERECCSVPRNRATRPYDLRHTFATLILEQGENPKVVQEVLGHSRITHIMDTYSHVSPNIQKEAFSRLGKRLEGS